MDDTPPTTPSAPPPARSSSVRGLVIFALVCFAVGIAVMGWLLSEWQPARSLLLGETEVAAPIAPSAPAETSATPPSEPKAILPTAEAHMAKIEEKLAIIDQQADSASTDAARAERMMIAFAARRALERGTPLGYLEGALMRQFGASDAGSVSIVIKAARMPVTLEQLEEGLDAARTGITSPDGEPGWFGSLWRDVGNIAVIKQEGEDRLSPDQRFDRARRALERDRVEIAMYEVRAMPGRDRAKEWLEKADRYVQARKALDRLEAITLAVSPAPAV